MKDKEVMQQALEALRDAIDYTDDEASSPKVTRQCADAIADLESAIAQTAQPTVITWNADGVRTVNGVPDSAQPVQPSTKMENFLAIIRTAVERGEFTTEEILARLYSDVQQAQPRGSRWSI